MALRDVNRKLAKIDSRCELVNNRDGYLYYTFSDRHANVFETESIYVCYFNSYTDDEWVEMGKEFIGRMSAMVEEKNKNN